MVAGLAALATSAAVVVPHLASAEEKFVSGSGKAKTQILRIGPSSAKLSLAPSVGVALADHLGVLGRGESLVVDYAALDGTVQDDLNGQPVDPKRKQLPPLRVESTQEGAAGGREQRAVPTVVQRARADQRPFGYAAAEVEAFDIPGVVHISGGRAESYSGVIEATVDGQKKTVREAGGTVDIAEAMVGSDTIGHIKIDGLHWEAYQRTDRNDDTEPELVATFSFGKLTILDPSGAKQEHFGPTDGKIPKEMRDGLAQFAAATGLTVRLPELITTGGVTRLTPFGFSIIESPIGKQVFSPIQSGIQPVRNQVTDNWLKNCQEKAGEDNAGNCGLPFLVADLLIGPLAGGGRLDIELGGVSGFTEGQVFGGFDFNFAGGFDTGTFDVAPAPEIATDAPVLDTGTQVLGKEIESVPTPSAPAEQPATVTEAPPNEVAAPQLFKLTGSRASAAWAVGLVGLGAALTMAASDYRRLRGRRRAITPIS